MLCCGCTSPLHAGDPVTNLLGLEVDNVFTAQSFEFLPLEPGRERHLIVVDVSTGVVQSINPRSTENIRVFSFPKETTLLPGFIDCHVHLTIGAGDYQMDHLRQSSADKSLRALRAAQGLLHAGFTTVRSAGDADQHYPSFAVARSIERGEFLGPLIVGAGHYISVTGGGGDISTLSPENDSCCHPDGLIADGPDEVVRVVRKEIKYGSSWIKLLVTGAFMAGSSCPQDSPEVSHMSWTELDTAVREATQRRVPVMAHAHGADGIADAAAAGCRSIEHASFIDSRGIEACKKHGAWIVPTLLVGEHCEDGDDLAQPRQKALEKATEERHRSCLRTAIASGVKVALGSDFVGWDPAITAREFRLLVERGGMSPAAAIVAGTSSAAQLLQIKGVGVVAAGSVADLVVVQGNPLEDISALERHVIFVMKSGRTVRHE